MSDEKKEIFLATVRVKSSEAHIVRQVLDVVYGNITSLPESARLKLTPLSIEVVEMDDSGDDSSPLHGEVLRVGSVVRLNSGSREMTVTDVIDGDVVELRHFIPEHGVMSEPLLVPYQCVYWCS